MWKRILSVGATLVAVAGCCGFLWSQDLPCAAPSAGEPARQWVFDSKEALTGWTVTGDVSVDVSRGREGSRGSLKIGPGAKALLKLRDTDGAGKIDVWVFDDGTAPENVKARRAGPRWGLVQSDAKVLVIGALYANYLGGDEGYTASACDGKDWFDQLFWLGIRRAPPGWHRWTFDFDPEAGLQVLHNGKEVTAVDPGKVSLNGFNQFAVWGDGGPGPAQTIWLADLSVTLGGPATVPETVELDPYDERSVAADTAVRRPEVIYAAENASATPRLEDMPLKESVSQYGITWTFDKPTRVGQFVGGDWYVVGPATITAIDPRVMYGSEIPRRELDRMDRTGS